MTLRLFLTQWEILDELKLFTYGCGRRKKGLFERKDYLKNIPREQSVGLIYTLAVGFKRNRL